MLPKNGRFYIHGSSPMVMFTNEEDYPVFVQFWQSSTNESGSFQNTRIYFSFDKKTCTLDQATPMPEEGKILRAIIHPQESIYGVSDDQGRGGWIAQRVIAK